MPDPRAFNAYRHGLTGQVLVITPDEQEAYEKHCQGIHRSFAPQDAMETGLVQSIADDRWRLQRAVAMEANLFATGLNLPDKLHTGHEQSDVAVAMSRIWIEQSKALDRLTLYESRLQRKVEKNLALLRQLQQDRRQALEQAARQTAILEETYEIPSELLPAQFVFSKEEIHRAAAHFRRLAATGKTLRRAA